MYGIHRIRRTPYIEVDVVLMGWILMFLDCIFCKMTMILLFCRNIEHFLLFEGGVLLLLFYMTSTVFGRASALPMRGCIAALTLDRERALLFLELVAAHNAPNVSGKWDGSTVIHI